MASEPPTGGPPAGGPETPDWRATARDELRKADSELHAGRARGGQNKGHMSMLPDIELESIKPEDLKLDLPALKLADLDSKALSDHLDAIIPMWHRIWDKISAKDVEELVKAGKIAKKDKVKKVWPSQQPVVRVQKLDEQGRAHGLGRRKKAEATVTLSPGTGKIEINGRSLAQYFMVVEPREHAIAPLVATAQIGKFDVQVEVSGGGPTGQAGAIRLGIARALQNYDPMLRKIMKPLGFLTRDSRRVEPKKIGQPKARKKKQWVKR